MSQNGVMAWEIAATPVAIIDFETTGLRAGPDRVVEVSIVRKDPGRHPRLVFDTLINPERRVSATEIHGITDNDVSDAPTWKEICPVVTSHLSGCVIASYNVYFDIAFLEYELLNAGIDVDLPHFCLMYFRPMLSLGGRCCLANACADHGIAYTPAHWASVDALAAGNLFEYYLQVLADRRVSTYAELSELKDYKFVKSFASLPIAPVQAASRTSVRLKSRAGWAADSSVGRTPPTLPVNPLGVYWDALATILSDLVVTDEELITLQNTCRQLGLAPAQVRALHAKAFANVMGQCTEDRDLSEREVVKLHTLHKCLSRLGWAPGELISPG